MNSTNEWIHDDSTLMMLEGKFSFTRSWRHTHTHRKWTLKCIQRLKIHVNFTVCNNFCFYFQSISYWARMRAREMIKSIRRCGSPDEHLHIAAGTFLALYIAISSSCCRMQKKLFIKKISMKNFSHIFLWEMWILSPIFYK